MSKQKSYTKEFKFKVAVEMIKGDLTIAEIISKYQVPRSVLSKWKKSQQLHKQFQLFLALKLGDTKQKEFKSISQQGSFTMYHFRKS